MTITKAKWDAVGDRVVCGAETIINASLGNRLPQSEREDIAKLIAAAPETKRQRDNLLVVKNKLKVRVNNAENALMHIGNFVSTDDVDAQLRGAIQTIINNVLFEG